MSLPPSRWASLPPSAQELPPATLAGGFLASGVAAGLKRSGKEDVGLLFCTEEGASSALRLTRSAAAAAPVVVCRQRCNQSAVRGAVVNSGCANAGTGAAGYRAALAMQEEAARQLGLAPEEVAVCSTGTIGDKLPLEKVVGGIARARATLAPVADAFQRAILTTDAYPKQAALALSLGGGTVTLSAQCKGAGMIAPCFATTLCFIQTDARLAPPLLEDLLREAVAASFERISVDGQLSTNDTVVMIASGAAGVEVTCRESEAFQAVLHALCRRLALAVVKDGEGAKRIGRVVVEAAQPAQAEAVARAVGNSPLVKAALHGGDPNWGRILQAAGAALEGTADGLFSISIEGVEVYRAGEPRQFDRAALFKAVAAEEVEYRIRVGAGGAKTAELFFSDLSHRYVTINAEYTT